MLVVIDPRVEDYAMLAAGVHEGTNVFILDLNRDGVEQITEALAQHPTSTLHIVSHGSPGCLAVGNTYLSLENLDRYADDLQTWSIFLSSASVFLYGCNVAAGEVGEAFLSKLHQLTGANIAASANPTGSTVKGGDWELEVTIGKIEAPLAFSEAVREAYISVLVTVPSTDGGVVTVPSTDGGVVTVPSTDGGVVTVPSTDGGVVTVPSTDGGVVTVPSTDGGVVTVPSTDGGVVTVPSTDGGVVTVPSTDGGVVTVPSTGGVGLYCTGGVVTVPSTDVVA
jgi:hypothetical protein